MTHLLSFADINIFSPEIGNFCYIKKYRYALHFNAKFNFFESLKDVSINMVAIFKTSAKLAALYLLKITIFEIKNMTS